MSIFLNICLVGVPRSCQEVKIKDHSAGDGEYFISLEPDTFAKIYCHNMSSLPLEYIKLEAGTSFNYAVNYHGNCNSSRRGISHFHMIRLYIEVFIKMFLFIMVYNTIYVIFMFTEILIIYNY